MQSIAETCVRFDAAHLSINLVSEIAVPMFTTLIGTSGKLATYKLVSCPAGIRNTYENPSGNS